MDDDTERFLDLRQIKLRRLHELDKQAAMLGDAQTPAHIQVERAQLRAELETVESVIGWSHARPAIGDELGPNGRFLAYMAESKRGNTEAHRAFAEATRANEGIAALGEQVAGLAEEVRTIVRTALRWGVRFGIALAVLFVVVAVVVTIVLLRGS